MSGWEEVLAHAVASGVDGEGLIARAQARGVSAELVIEAFRRADQLGQEFDRRGLLPPFEAFEAFPPGSIDVRVFDQEVWWVDVLRIPYRICFPQSFTDEHLLNVVAYLVENAEDHHRAYGLTVPWGTVPTDPTRWLEQTILMRALKDQAQGRGLQP